MRSALSVLDPASFDAIADLAYRESGLTLVREKATMVQSRLRHRLRALGLQDFIEYSAFVNSDAGTAERRELISALTTNVSHFFREAHHFEHMCKMVAQRLCDLRQGRTLRIWSAGCANGQEPLSAAIGLIDRFPEVTNLDLRILATDIDSQVIKMAHAGRYTKKQLGGLSKDQIESHFSCQSSTGDGFNFVADQKLRSLVRYNQMNLLGVWPMRRQFDMIFCRNVVIYFDHPTQERLWPRFNAALKNDGALYLGHSERIADPKGHGFVCDGPTTYRKAVLGEQNF